MFYKSQIFYEQELCFSLKEKFRIIYACQKFTEYFFKVNIVVSDVFPFLYKVRNFYSYFRAKKGIHSHNFNKKIQLSKNMGD